MSRKKIIIASIVLIIVICAVAWLLLRQHRAQSKTVTTSTAAAESTNVQRQPGDSTTSSQTQPTAPTPVPPANTTWPIQLSMTDAASLTVVVNKKHKLPDTYVPAGLTTYGGVQLRAEAASAMTNLVNAAGANGITIKMISGYRSFASQTTVYNNYVVQDGQAAADTYSARPGFSEHQTGLAVDVGSSTCDLDTCFGDTAAGQWVAANAQNYGFIVRYPKGKETDTGYQYEPWHLRYLGVDTAKAVYTSGKTLDQYYNVTAGGYQ